MSTEPNSQIYCLIWTAYWIVYCRFELYMYLRSTFEVYETLETF